MEKKFVIFGLLGSMIFVLVLVKGFQPDYLVTRAVWYGGLLGHNRIIEGKSLDQISAEANLLAAIHGGPVQFRTEDGRIVYQAYPEAYNESRCANVREKVWQEGVLIMNNVMAVCIVPTVVDLPAIEG